MAALVIRLLYPPCPVLLGLRDIAGGQHGEAAHGQADGVDVNVTFTPFGPCIFEGGAEGVGAQVNGVHVVPTGLRPSHCA